MVEKKYCWGKDVLVTDCEIDGIKRQSKFTFGVKVKRVGEGHVEICGNKKSIGKLLYKVGKEIGNESLYMEFEQACVREQKGRACLERARKSAKGGRAIDQCGARRK